MKHSAIIKKIIIIQMFIFFMILNFTTVFATGDINLKNPTDQSFKNAINIIISIFQTVAVGVGVIMLIVLAIKYMVSSPGDRAEIKKHAVVYIVGAVIAFGATGIIEIIKDFAQKNI